MKANGKSSGGRKQAPSAGPGEQAAVPTGPGRGGGNGGREVTRRLDTPSITRSKSSRSQAPIGAELMKEDQEEGEAKGAPAVVQRKNSTLLQPLTAGIPPFPALPETREGTDVRQPPSTETTGGAAAIPTLATEPLERKEDGRSAMEEAYGFSPFLLSPSSPPAPAGDGGDPDLGLQLSARSGDFYDPPYVIPFPKLPEGDRDGFILSLLEREFPEIYPPRPASPPPPPPPQSVETKEESLENTAIVEDKAEDRAAGRAAKGGKGGKRDKGKLPPLADTGAAATASAADKGREPRQTATRGAKRAGTKAAQPAVGAAAGGGAKKQKGPSSTDPPEGQIGGKGGPEAAAARAATSRGKVGAKRPMGAEQQGEVVGQAGEIAEDLTSEKPPLTKEQEAKERREKEKADVFNGRIASIDHGCVAAIEQSLDMEGYLEQMVIQAIEEEERILAEADKGYLKTTRALIVHEMLAQMRRDEFRQYVMKHAEALKHRYTKKKRVGGGGGGVLDDMKFVRDEVANTAWKRVMNSVQRQLVGRYVYER
ncbi:hypothetical protein CBR_g38616 [Chara braunii]|uniref:Uncharacterized protein n=1 Tax=Chara braunii TaxID=69332 RepID=A0A388K0H4_CHABU|nr:hypothetical protein CBR_g38616 [Chara braunii]|eukprot:GBG63549.1 hypothetical protein CBR_g38616 [Chara braunii]